MIVEGAGVPVLGGDRPDLPAGELARDLALLVDVDVVADDRGLGPRDALLRDGLSLSPRSRGQNSSNSSLVSIRSALAELPTAVTHVRSRAVGLTMIGSPRSSSSLGGSGSTVVERPPSAAPAATAPRPGRRTRLVLHRLDEPGLRHDEAESLGEPLPVLRDEDHRLVGAVHEHRRAGCRRANSTSRSARASSCRSPGSIQSHVMTLCTRTVTSGPGRRSG